MIVNAILKISISVPFNIHIEILQPAQQSPLNVDFNEPTYTTVIAVGTTPELCISPVAYAGGYRGFKPPTPNRKKLL